MSRNCFLRALEEPSLFGTEERMDKKSTSILESALTKCEVSLLSMTEVAKRSEFERQIRELRSTLVHYVAAPPTISEALTTAKRVLDLRAAVLRAVVQEDLSQLHFRDRNRALAYYARSQRAHCVEASN